MILVGNQRGGARNLALHLMKPENDHVSVHEVRGFISDDLHGAFHEAYAVSRGTRCKQFLFSLSLNPPKNERVSTDVFENAIERIETKLGLTGQPRAIVFHEKEGRRHAHAVWSRINAEEMKALQLSHSRTKLMEVSRDLYREHNWNMPKGLTDRSQRDPRNFTLAEWQQCKRNDKDPRTIKTAIQDAWAISDSKAALTHALEERGFKLARGDRRGFLALDHTGELYALAKYAGVKTKEVRKRLGDHNTLPSIEEAKADIARGMIPALDRMQSELETREQARKQELERRRLTQVERQRAMRQTQLQLMETRRVEEARRRQAQFRQGLSGAWDYLRGEHKRIQQQNEREAYSAMTRDRAQKDELVFRHLRERQHLKLQALQIRDNFKAQAQELKQDAQHYERMAETSPQDRLQRLREKRTNPHERLDQPRNRDGPDIGR